MQYNNSYKLTIKENKVSRDVEINQPNTFSMWANLIEILRLRELLMEQLFDN